VPRDPIKELTQRRRPSAQAGGAGPDHTARAFQRAIILVPADLLRCAYALPLSAGLATEVDYVSVSLRRRLVALLASLISLLRITSHWGAELKWVPTPNFRAWARHLGAPVNHLMMSAAPASRSPLSVTFRMYDRGPTPQPRIFAAVLRSISSPNRRPLGLVIKLSPDPERLRRKPLGGYPAEIVHRRGTFR
jgi:hypothetical protein